MILFSNNLNTFDELKHRQERAFIECNSADEVFNELQKSLHRVVIADYDSVSSDVNRFIATNQMPSMLIVLENAPALATGKMLLSHGVKAYGNTKMLKHHFEQMIKTVERGDIWSYPELTAALVAMSSKRVLSEESEMLVESRLSTKEKEILYLILEGLTNEAIAQKTQITTRTVKAHVSSIFSKLHVNDRLSLVLLLK